MLNATTFTEPTEDEQRNRKRINGRCGGDDDDDDYDVDDVFSNKEDCPKPPLPLTMMSVGPQKQVMIKY